LVHGALRRARQLRVVGTLGLYTVLSPFGYVLLALVARVGSADPVARTRRMQRVSTTAYRLVHDWLRWMRIVRFDHRRALPALPARPCVVVANHPTLMDITAITAVLGGGCTVAKPSLYRRRMFHRLLEASGAIEGPGNDPVAAGRVVDAAVQRIEQGFSLILFPEGTRSPPDRLLPFGRAAFEIACRARVPVVSLGIRCVPIWLSKEVPLFQPPHPMPDLQLALLATDDPALVDYDSRRLREAVEERFRSWYLRGCSTEPARDGAEVIDTVDADQQRLGRCRTRSKIA
jgi:1-acyl-sn-glycerol-3-phosphate acyltransferase